MNSNNTAVPTMPRIVIYDSRLCTEPTIPKDLSCDGNVDLYAHDIANGRLTHVWSFETSCWLPHRPKFPPIATIIEEEEEEKDDGQGK